MKISPRRRQRAHIDGKPRRDLDKLSPSQWERLFDALHNRCSLEGRSQFGAAQQTFASLRRMGFLDAKLNLTEQGREATRVQWIES